MKKSDYIKQQSWVHNFAKVFRLLVSFMSILLNALFNPFDVYDFPAEHCVRSIEFRSSFECVVSTFGNINTHESFGFRNFCLFNGNKMKKIIISFCFNARKLDLSTLIRYFNFKRSLCTVFIRRQNLSSFSKRKLGFFLFFLYVFQHGDVDLF